MPDEKKGITVKIDAGLHAQVREYVEAHGMTMAEFMSRALDNELHPKFQMKEVNTMMGNTRTIAFQVPEELYQRIKDYLNRNGMTQKQFFLGLVEAELEREQEELEAEQPEEDLEPEEETGYGIATTGYAETESEQFGDADDEADQFGDPDDEADLTEDEAPEEQGMALTM